MHHRREEGVESDGVGRLNLPVNEDKHRADKFSQTVRTAIKQKQKKRGRKKKRRGRAKRRRARKAAQTRQKGRLVRVATYNVRTLAVKGANVYGRDFSVLYEAARLDISVVGLQDKEGWTNGICSSRVPGFLLRERSRWASRGGVSRERVDLQQLHLHH